MDPWIKEMLGDRNPRMLRIDDLELSVRTINCLKMRGINTLGALTAWSEKELLRIKNFGQRCLNEVNEMLSQFDLSLREGVVLTLEEQMQDAITRARAARHAFEGAMADVQRIAKRMVEEPIVLPEVEI